MLFGGSLSKQKMFVDKLKLNSNFRCFRREQHVCMAEWGNIVKSHSSRIKSPLVDFPIMKVVAASY